MSQLAAHRDRWWKCLFCSEWITPELLDSDDPKGTEECFEVEGQGHVWVREEIPDRSRLRSRLRRVFRSGGPVL